MSALQANLAEIRAAAGPEFEVLGVVKANAYGHGAALCAPVLVRAGAPWLGVGDLEEGVRVRAALAAADLANRETRLLVMCGFEAEDAAGIVAAGLTPVVWTAAHVQALQRAAQAAGTSVAVHLEIDTGMARQGAAPGAELTELLSRLRGCPAVLCEGVFSHLSSSEVVGSAETARQRTRFEQALAQVVAAQLRPAWLHLGNSSAVDEGSTLGWVRAQARVLQARSMVRPGLGLYGYALPLEPAPKSGLIGPGLHPVATWKTRITGLREIAAEDTVGYGATFAAKRPMRLALLPVGYADGFRREASSGLGDGWVMIAGGRAPVVGRVSMNLTVVDVTEHRTVGEGDEVVLLGEGVTAEDHARWAGTIPYEILCGMRGHRRLV